MPGTRIPRFAMKCMRDLFQTRSPSGFRCYKLLIRCGILQDLTTRVCCQDSLRYRLVRQLRVQRLHLYNFIERSTGARTVSDKLRHAWNLSDAYEKIQETRGTPTQRLCAPNSVMTLITLKSCSCQICQNESSSFRLLPRSHFSTNYMRRHKCSRRWFGDHGHRCHCSRFNIVGLWLRRFCGVEQGSFRA